MKKHLALRLTSPKAKPYLWGDGYKNRYDKLGNMIWSNLSIKVLGINFNNFIPDNSTRDKISIKIAKRIHIWNTVRLCSKTYYKPNFSFKTLVHRTNLYNFKIY